MENLKYEFNCLEERLFGKDFIKKMDVEGRCSILEAIKVVPKVVGKIATPLYGDILMADITKQAIKEEPKYKGLCISMFGISLVAKYFSFGMFVYIVSQIASK